MKKQKEESKLYDDFKEYLTTQEKEYKFRQRNYQWIVTETYQEYSYGS